MTAADLALVAVVVIVARILRARRSLRVQRRVARRSAGLVRRWVRGPRRCPVHWCRLVAGVARRVPGADCLPRAVAAEGLLRALGEPARLRLGVATSVYGLRAHAWVECRRERLIGGRVAADYRALRRRGPRP